MHCVFILFVFSFNLKLGSAFAMKNPATKRIYLPNGPQNKKAGLEYNCIITFSVFIIKKEMW